MELPMKINMKTTLTLVAVFTWIEMDLSQGITTYSSLYNRCFSTSEILKHENKNMHLTIAGNEECVIIRSLLFRNQWELKTSKAKGNLNNLNQI